MKSLCFRCRLLKLFPRAWRADLFLTKHDKPIEKILSESENRLIYVYDFLNLWTFYVELIEIAQKEVSKGYPSLIFTHGEVPETPPNKEFGGSNDLSDDLKTDEDDYDNFY